MAARRLLGVVKGFAVWLVVFIPSAIASSVVYAISRNAILSVAIIELLFVVLSITVVKFALKPEDNIIGFRIIGFTKILTVFLLSTLLAILIAYVELHTAPAERYSFPIPGVEEQGAMYFILAFALAPVGEETLFRGLFLGYILENDVNPWMAITISALLFSLIHLIPFSTAPLIQRTYIIGTAFIMSMIAGCCRKRMGSLLPAIATHVGFNLGGFISPFLP
ncbi:MAG: CPBP family intramembrane metalloprotease [Candidatus Verstraetearchaeota archaeon]|nr:CPBP family intramembrane metalloprotease [Candidatus Verstraetearchaeota archaeon]